MPSTDPFANAGSLRGDYEATDWAATALGPVDGWTPALRAALDLMFGTRFPVTLLWGPELVLVYNERYVDLISAKHPQALGSRTEDVFPEAWDQIGPMLHGVLDGGPATWSEDQLLPLERSGFLEEAYFTFSYSPVHGPGGDVEGIIDISVETTARQIVSRRLQLLTRLHAVLGSVHRLDDLTAAALTVLAEAPDDLVAVELRSARAGGEPRDERLPAELAPDDGGEVVLVDGPAGPVAWLPVSRGVASYPDTTLVVLLSAMLRADEDYVDFVRLVGFAITQHVERLVAREAERTLSAALQASMLSRPPATTSYDIAVRYQPSAELAQVGGDWYDAFRLPDGAMSLVVGDVAGHDHGAAAYMGQLRNLVRGVAYQDASTPSAVLTGLERTMEGLAVQAVATALVGQLHDDPAGGLTFRWSNAGHPPPIVVDPDGAARLLDPAPDLLLGLDAGAERTDHAVGLEPGSTLVLYTDGLVERRGEHLDDSLDWLCGLLGQVPTQCAEDVCDHLLAHVSGSTEDDVALLVVSVPA